ncbi:hypothetical protein [Nonomuraea sp. NPDC049480]|uniref:hypothetical protein n=1 Tax=Nonomuraea sp. NPDC049480 TaxID=3364353 RepID=UPI0037A23999
MSDWAEISSGATVRLFSTPGDLAYQDFSRRFYEVAAEAGIPTVPDPFDGDLVPFRQAGQAAVREVGEDDKAGGAMEALLLICVFIGTEAGSWVVGQVCTRLWDRLRGAFSAVGSDSRGELAKHSIVARTVYGPDQIVVEVEMSFDAATPPEEIGNVIAEVQRRSVDPGLSKAIVSYRWAAGELEGPTTRPLPEE